MDCGIVTSKTVLFFLSLVFWAAGAALFYVGFYMIKSYDSFDGLIQDKYTLIPAAIIISISVVMFIFGLIGCCATFFESKVGLGFFFLIIMLIFAAEVTALAFCFIYQGRISKELVVSMTKVFSNYDGGDAQNNTVDFVQTEFQCCGVQNYKSWSNTTWFASHKDMVPLSCCKNMTDTLCTGRMDQANLINLQGCEPKVVVLLQGVMSYAMLVILGFVIIKFFGMMSVCVITCKAGGRRRGYQPLYA